MVDKFKIRKCDWPGSAEWKGRKWWVLSPNGRLYFEDTFNDSLQRVNLCILSEQVA